MSKDDDRSVQCWHTEPGTPCDWHTCRQPERLARSDILAFLRARFDEDFTDARAAKPGPWHADGGSVYATHPTDEVVTYTESADHIARHHPKRVLAEVEAKRKLLELHREIEDPEAMQDFCYTCDVTGEYPEYPCTTLRLLALPYASHPDYRDTWRP
ncbi:DUF6221 family protein [Streptomyces sp. NPDC057235]|uniref:DUF6221 family protein n=1 Tax=Streptomyces sp. NPDC057235 TaxID=3346058 RepID=UPI0036415A17